MKCCRSKPTTEEKDLPKKSPPKLPNPNRFVRPKFVVRKGKGMANVPFWKTNIGRIEVFVELLAESPEELEVAVEEELMLTETEGALVLVVTKLELVRPEETERPSTVPSTRQIGNNDRKSGVQST